jgi:hypothetical protein
LVRKKSTVEILKIERDVPVEESHGRLNSIFYASVDNIVIVLKSLNVDLAISKGEDARPTDRKKSMFSLQEPRYEQCLEIN